ncbi:MAG: hypothetical protein JNG84_01645 [Archangium sp.]|nr:hypothetical protein [Archangium sp.]
MRTPFAFANGFSLPLLASLIMACQPAAPVTPGEAMPDFTLTDVNPASMTAGQPVSVRSLQGRVSAWYFTHTT